MRQLSQSEIDDLRLVVVGECWVAPDETYRRGILLSALGENRGGSVLRVERSCHTQNCLRPGHVVAEWRKTSRKRNPYDPAARRLKLHGIGPEEWDALVRSQAGACARCGEQLRFGRGQYAVVAGPAIWCMRCRKQKKAEDAGPVRVPVAWSTGFRGGRIHVVNPVEVASGANVSLCGRLLRDEVELFGESGLPPFNSCRQCQRRFANLVGAARLGPGPV